MIDGTYLHIEVDTVTSVQGVVIVAFTEWTVQVMNGNQSKRLERRVFRLKGPNQNYGGNPHGSEDDAKQAREELLREMAGQAGWMTLYFVADQAMVTRKFTGVVLVGEEGDDLSGLPIKDMDWTPPGQRH
ncbi:hypothetical protein [Luteibacter aegosomatissinici]|uniref:hypothetical protein n=1 Tax=Luteibacter aegosomatissinici TaxID=2911539 RepID=UPI001FF73D24|nr:hypothetical protein [Luteibacter aegosomatissinici]UPG92824.1 hypothetical protein L2Y97_13210 [Luteibacter aegosomatissinici]